tara:strand:- start:342 stop:965 length:624 start_codon:yes stop_codon:yes gene_type:complete
MAITGIGLGLSALGALAAGGAAYGEAASAMSEEEKERLRQLERMQAIGMLGGDYNVAMGKQMTPVQGAMREAKDRMAQDISTQDMSSGAYFRGQQAMETAAAKERSAAAERAQADMAQQEAMQMKEMENLRKLKKIQDNALIYGMKGAAGPLADIGGGLTDIGLAREEQLRIENAAKLAESQKLKALKTQQKYLNLYNKNKNNPIPG